LKREGKDLVENHNDQIHIMNKAQQITIIIWFSLLSIPLFSQITISGVLHPSTTITEDGWIEVNAKGSASPFRVILFGSATGAPIAESSKGFTSGSFRFEELGVGSYYAMIFDKDGCETVLDNIELIEEARCQIIYSITALIHVSEINYTNQTSTDDGAISISIENPELYHIRWYGPSGYTSQSTSISGLSSGIYRLSITDINNSMCEAMDEFYINYCNQLADINGVETVISGLDPVVLGDAVITSPANGTCNGRIQVPPSVNQRDKAYVLAWYDDSGEVIGNNIWAVENLCPGNYQLQIIDGCYPDQFIDFTLYDCTIDPISLTLLNDCTDPAYDGSFSLLVSGGENTELNPEWLDTGNGRVYFAEDERGCKAEYEFKYSEIGDWDIQYEVVKPYNGIGDPVVGVTILNADGDQAPFSIVGILDNIPINEPIDVVLEGARSGIYPVDFENKNGCGRRVFFEITDCSNYENKSPLSTQVKVDYGDGIGPVVANSLSECAGNISLEVVCRGGLAPYDIFVSSKSDPEWAGVTILNTNETTSLIMSLTSSRDYSVVIVDDCKETVFRDITPCNICDFDYESDGRKFIIGSSGALNLEFSRACGISDFNDAFFDPRIKLNKVDHLFQDWELPIIIEWPANGGTTTIDRDANGHITLSNPSGDDDGISINAVFRDDGTDLSTRVTRGDGCSLDIPFEYAKDKVSSGTYITGERLQSFVPENSTELARAYSGAVACSVCIPFNQEEFANPSENDCFENGFDATYFEWKPTNATNPCNGGGILKFYYYDFETNKIKLIEVPIEPNNSVLEIADAAGLGNVHAYNCSEGGACFFNSNAISLIPNLDRLIVATYCSATQNPEECYPECPEKQLCIEGACYDPVSCDEIDINLIKVKGSPTYRYNIPESMVGQTLYLTWESFGVADELDISGVITRNTLCTKNLVFTEEHVIQSAGELIVKVKNNCELKDGSQFTLKLSCSPPPALIDDTDTKLTKAKIDFDPFDLKAYPNPSSDYFTVKTTGTLSDQSLILIHNSLGEKVEEYIMTAGHEINVLQDKPNGIYTATLYVEDSSRIVKQLIKVD